MNVNEILVTSGKHPGFFQIVSMSEKSVTLQPLRAAHGTQQYGHDTHHSYFPRLDAPCGKPIRRTYKHSGYVKVESGAWGRCARSWDGKVVTVLDDNCG